MGTLGTDFVCLTDFDGSFSTTSDDTILMRQYAFHKLVAGALLDSDSPEGWRDWGCLVRQYCGQGFTDAQIAALGPTIAIQLANDPEGPIDNAEVIARRSSAEPAFEMTLDTTIFTSVGPLRLVCDIGLAGARLQE